MAKQKKGKSPGKDLEAGQKLMGEGEFKKALNKFKKVLKEDQKNAMAWFLKAECYIGVPKMNDDEVLEAYNKAIELEEGNPFFYLSRGAFCLESGKWTIAEESYKKAAELDEENEARYLSEFGVEYFNAMSRKYGDKKEYMKEAKKKAATYLLMSIGLDVDEFKTLFK
jgi:tetratricopeptide (TPR) repeat protein